MNSDSDERKNSDSDSLTNEIDAEIERFDVTEARLGRKLSFADIVKKHKEVLMIVVSSIVCLCVLVLILLIRLISSKISVGGQDELSFVVIGDFGRENQYNQDKVALSLATFCKQQKCDFAISTGDNLYPVGVETADDELFKLSFEDVYLKYSSLKKLPFYMVLGNHDWASNPDAQVEYARREDTNWILPDRYYAKFFEKFKAKFVFLDTTIFFPDTHPIPADTEKFLAATTPEEQRKQINFLNEELSSDDADWLFVVNHHPLYTAGDHWDDGDILQTKLEHLLKEYKVDAQIAGHDHNLQHLRRNNIEYLVSGAGSKLRTVFPSYPQLQWAAAVNGFMHVSLSGNMMKVQFIDVNGNVLHSFVRSK